MRKLVIGAFLSLDGVMEAPEKWTFPYFNEEVGALRSICPHLFPKGISLKPSPP
jgi:hypothetical protein